MGEIAKRQRRLCQAVEAIWGALSIRLAKTSMYCQYFGESGEIFETSNKLHQKSQELWKSHLEIQYELNNKSGIFSLSYIGKLALDQRNITATRLLDESFILPKWIGNKWALGGLLTDLGEISHKEKKRFSKGKSALWGEFGNTAVWRKKYIYIAECLENLGSIIVCRGEKEMEKAQLFRLLFFIRQNSWVSIEPLDRYKIWNAN